MLGYQARVAEEKAELDVKLDKLRLFKASETYSELHGLDQELISSQLKAMVRYSAILGARIARF